MINKILRKFGYEVVTSGKLENLTKEIDYFRDQVNELVEDYNSIESLKIRFVHKFNSDLDKCLLVGDSSQPVKFRGVWSDYHSDWSDTNKNEQKESPLKNYSEGEINNLIDCLE